MLLVLEPPHYEELSVDQIVFLIELNTNNISYIIW